MPGNPSPIRRLPRNVWIVTVTSFLTDISSEMIVNLIPLFWANVLGVRTMVIGLIDGLAETTASLMKLYSGYLSDKFGERKLLTVIGYGFSALAKPFLFFCEYLGLGTGCAFCRSLGQGDPRRAMPW